MKYMRRTAGLTWTDYKTNLHIAKELEITPVLDKLHYQILCNNFAIKEMGLRNARKSIAELHRSAEQILNKIATQ